MQLFIAAILFNFGLSGSEESAGSICERIGLLRAELEDTNDLDDWDYNKIVKQIQDLQESMGGENSDAWKECKYTVVIVGGSSSPPAAGMTQSVKTTMKVSATMKQSDADKLCKGIGEELEVEAANVRGCDLGDERYLEEQTSKTLTVTIDVESQEEANKVKSNVSKAATDAAGKIDGVEAPTDIVSVVEKIETTTTSEPKTDSNENSNAEKDGADEITEETNEGDELTENANEGDEEEDQDSTETKKATTTTTKEAKATTTEEAKATTTEKAKATTTEKAKATTKKEATTTTKAADQKEKHAKHEKEGKEKHAKHEKEEQEKHAKHHHEYLRK